MANKYKTRADSQIVDFCIMHPEQWKDQEEVKRDRKNQVKF